MDIGKGLIVVGVVVVAFCWTVAGVTYVSAQEAACVAELSELVDWPERVYEAVCGH